MNFCRTSSILKDLVCLAGWSPPVRLRLLDFTELLLLFFFYSRQASRQSSSPSVSPILFAKCLANPFRQLGIAVCTAGPHPPGSDRSVHRWTSSARVRSQCAPLDLNRQTECQNIWQKVCQNLCQVECQNIWQIKCSSPWYKNISRYMPNRMPKYIANRYARIDVR